MSRQRVFTSLDITEMFQGEDDDFFGWTMQRVLDKATTMETTETTLTMKAGARRQLECYWTWKLATVKTTTMAPTWMQTCLPLSLLRSSWIST